METIIASLGLPGERYLTQAADLGDAAQTRVAAQAVLARFGRVDILLHLVGGWTGGKRLVEVPAADLENMLTQHVWTTFHLAQAFVPHLVQNGWGRIVVISSPSASQPRPKGGPYAIGKAGQEALMLTLAQELRGSGVTANLLQVKTIDARGEKHATPSPENASWSTPEEIAAAILFLLSDEAGTINGARIPLFGG